MSASSTPIRLIVIDDHGLFRESLGRLLGSVPGLMMVGDYAEATDALEQIASGQVDFVLLDFDLGDHNGLQFLREARHRGFFGPILVVTGGLSQRDMVRVFETGASGVFLKHSPPSELLLAIRKVMAGETWLDSKSVGMLVEAASGRREARTDLLNGLQKDVLRGVFDGLTNKEIGTRLDISEAYVKAILQQLFAKTGVRSRSQLVRVVLENQAKLGVTLDS